MGTKTVAKTVAITGATGFLGRHVVKAISNAGYIPIAVVRNVNSARTSLGHNIEIRKADIGDLDALSAAFVGVDAAIHLAGLVSLNKCHQDLLDKVNVGGAKNFIKAADNNAIKRVIFTSTTSAVAALNDDNSDNALDENAVFNLIDQSVNYIKTKRTAHLLAVEAQDKGLPVVILSPSFVLGPDDINVNTSSLIDAIRRRRLPVYPDGGINPIDVRDLAQAYVAVLEKRDPARHYILASKENLTLKKLCNRAALFANVAPPLFSAPNSLIMAIAAVTEALFPKASLTPEGVRLSRFYWYFDASLARADLNLNCRSLEQTLMDTLEWLKGREQKKINTINWNQNENFID